MKAGIFDPYLDTLGGGERYIMTVAHILSEKGWDVGVEWNEDAMPAGRQGILENLEDRLGIDLSDVRIVSSIHNGKGYDVCFWLSDGSIPNLHAKKNILHFQVPFHDVGGKSIFNRLKLRKIYKVVCNSQFTKRFIDKEYSVDSIVVYPPVDVDKIKPLKKQNIILSVGRFSQLLQAKRQDVLIEVFKKMTGEGLKGWKLIIVGGSEVSGEEFAGRLRVAAHNYPIEIIENSDFDTLKRLYGKAKIFWSASGYGIDDEKEPGRVEHFGIVAVEAMSAECIPILVNKGGFKEIIKEGENGFLWGEELQLIERTNELIKSGKFYKKLASQARKDAQQFSNEKFEKEIIELLEE